MSDWSLRPSIHSCDMRLVTEGAYCKFILFCFSSGSGLSAQNDEFVFGSRSSGWILAQTTVGLGGMEGWRSTGLGVASALGLILHRSRAGFDSPPLKNFCRVPFVMPFSVCVCALQKSYSRNYLEFYLALRDYF